MFLILIFSFLFIDKIRISAQVNGLLVPGVNCGIAGDIKTSKCCAPVEFNPIANPNISVLTSLRDLIIGPALDYVKTIISPVENFQKSLLIPCQSGIQSTNDPSDVNCRCTLNGLSPTPGPLQKLLVFCDNQTNTNDKVGCNSCIKEGGVYTGIGCVQGSIDKFIGQTVFGIGIGLAGGFSLLCIIYAAFMMQSSQGNPEKLKKAQEMITSCIMGLMLIIFSVFILRLIGVDILKIPGFN